MSDNQISGPVHSWMEPIIVIGAPRSGTKMLRELLKMHPLITGSLYEKERIWSHGNPDKESAFIGVEDLRQGIKEFIREQFKKEALKNRSKRIVDKNVANSLRIAYVREIFPESPFVHIVRDGRDGACSIRERWKNPADVKYILKNRAFPLGELPHYLKRQFKWRFEKLVTRKEHVKWWGPRFSDMEALAAQYSLIELCGIQWARCVESALEGMKKLNDRLWMQVKYEDLVNNPVVIMERLCEFLGLSMDDHLKNRFRAYVGSSRVGRWKTDLSQSEYDLLLRHIENTLRKLKYNVDCGERPRSGVL